MTETKWGVDKKKKKKRTTILAETAHFNSRSLLPFFFLDAATMKSSLIHKQWKPQRNVHPFLTDGFTSVQQLLTDLSDNIFFILPHQHYPYLDAGAVEKQWWYVLVLVQYWAEFLDVLKWCKGSFGRNNDIRSEPGAQKRGCGHQMQLLFINIHKQLYRELRSSPKTVTVAIVIDHVS